MATLSFETVRELGLSLPGVVEGTAYGAPALKLGSKTLVCIPKNKSAESNCLVAHVDFEHRAQLLEQWPETYFITDHYEPYPSVLVRLSKVTRAELIRLLRYAHTFVSSAPISKAASTKRRATLTVRKPAVTKNPKKR